MVDTIKIVANCCLNWIFFMAPSIVVLGTQIWNIEMRFQNLSIKVLL